MTYLPQTYFFSTKTPGVRVEVRKRSHLVGDIVYVKKKKKKIPLYLRHGGFAKSGDAGGQAGGKARSTEA
jgi:hypothetical protein